MAGTLRAAGWFRSSKASC